MSCLDDPEVMEASLKQLTTSTFPSSNSTDPLSSTTSVSSFSFPLSLALAIINRYRIRNGTDRFCCGRAPWVLEPVSFLLFTDGREHEGKDLTLTQLSGTSMGTGSDFVSDPWRWDHRVFLILTCGSGGQRNENVVPKCLANICGATGGDIIHCLSLKDIAPTMRALSKKILDSKSICVRFCSQKLKQKDDTTDSDERLYNGASILTRLIVKCDGEWPFPEAFDTRLKNTPPRQTHPVLQIIRDNRTNTPTAASAFLRMATELNVPMDIYPIICDNLFHQNLGVSADEKYAVGIAITNLSDGIVMNSASIIASEGPVHSGGNNLEGFGNHTNCVPFAILCPGKGAPGSVELVILPFNYPKILPLLKTAIDNLRGSLPSSLAASQTWTINWRQEYKHYLSTTPTYFHSSLSRMIQRLNLKILFQQQQLEHEKHHLNKNVQRKLQIAQSIAASDIHSIEKLLRFQWDLPMNPVSTLCHKKSIVEVAMAPLEIQLDAPQSVLDIETPNLLSTWERMRANIFGGSRGISLRGLGTRGQGDLRLAFVCGGTEENTLKNAGSYMDVLAKRQVLRDSQAEPEPDEDLPSGILKRKLEVNFGSKFKRNSNLEHVSGVVDTEGQDYISNTFKEIEAYFGDSPQYFVDDVVLEKSDASIITDHESDELCATETITVKSAALSTSSFESIGIKSKVLPCLGSPLKRVKRHHASIYFGVASCDPITSLSTSDNLLESFNVQNAPSPYSVVAVDISQDPEVERAMGIEMSVDQGNFEGKRSESTENPNGCDSCCWEKHFSIRQNRDYWFNPATGKSVWIDPTAK